jgi:ABC-2 type transport system permease protein
VLATIAISFNTLNKERSEGSLKVLFSYPIYRDQVILGKLLAIFATLGTLTLTSMAAAFSVFFYTSNLPVTLDIAVRLLFLALYSLLFLGVYTGLGVLVSLIFKDAKTSLLVLFVLVGLFNSEFTSSLGYLASNLLFGSELLVIPYQRGGIVMASTPAGRLIFDLIQRISPSYTYTQLSWKVLQETSSVVVEGAMVLAPSTLHDIVFSDIGGVAGLASGLVVTFAASYALFVREDVS